MMTDDSVTKRGVESDPLDCRAVKQKQIVRWKCLQFSPVGLLFFNLSILSVNLWMELNFQGTIAELMKGKLKIEESRLIKEKKCG